MIVLGQEDGPRLGCKLRHWNLSAVKSLEFNHEEFEDQAWMMNLEEAEEYRVRTLHQIYLLTEFISAFHPSLLWTKEIDVLNFSSKIGTLLQSQ